MNPRSSFFRKMVYLAGLAVLAFPMAWLSMPSTRVDTGGKLAKLRTEARLGQSDLGAIDPASEVIRMATLGLRGFAVTMLWGKANEFKKTEDWTSFQATLEQLARLQPYFVKVWQYQAWNLSYNVSVELDAVRDRFYYVKQGIEYLQNGIDYLRDNPTLLDDLGWFTGNKVGRADEHEIYRRLYKLDEDLNKNRPADRRDNWLVSKDWYDLAVESIDVKGQPLGTKNPTTFFDSPARSQISYAEAIEEEGVFQNRARTAWAEGERLWREYGEREMDASDGVRIRLLDLDKWKAEVERLEGELDALSPGLEETMQQEAVASLTPEQRKMLESPPAEPTAEESKLQQEAMAAMDISVVKVAARIAREQPEKASEAQQLALAIDSARRHQHLTDSNREVANYEYWRIRCALEQTPEALKARELVHEAERLFEEKADPRGARELYEQGVEQWAAALEKFPELPADSSTGSDLLDVVEDYSKVLAQLELSLADAEVADNFALWEIVEANDSQRKFAEALEARNNRITGKQPDAESLIDPADALSRP
jgi:hypothetical protein